MARIKNIDGSLKVVKRVSTTSSTVNSSGTVGYFPAPTEGVIKRVKVTAQNNLKTFLFALAEEDVLTAGNYDYINMIAMWRVNEPREDAKSGSTIYVLDKI